MTTSFKTLICNTLVLLASATGISATAQVPGAPSAPASGARPHGQGMKALDTNNDKMISRDEAKARPQLSKNFDAMDTNKDGQLSRSEIKAYRQAHKGEGKGPAKN